MQNALANTSFAIIENAPSRNLVSYSFSSEDDENREEECTVTAVQESENIGSQYHSEVIPHKIVIDDTVEAHCFEHKTIDMSSDNQVVELSASQDNVVEKGQHRCVHNEGAGASSQYQLQEYLTCETQMQMEGQQDTGAGSDNKVAQQEDNNEHKDANNNAKCSKEIGNNKEKLQRSRQTLLDRWLQVIHNADEQRQFKC